MVNYRLFTYTLIFLLLFFRDNQAHDAALHDVFLRKFIAVNNFANNIVNNSFNDATDTVVTMEKVGNFNFYCSLN